MRRRRSLHSVLVIACLLTGTLALAWPQSTAASAINVQFYGSPDLSQLVQGATGQGVLLYTRSSQPADQPVLAVRLSKAASEDVARAEIFTAPSGQHTIPVTSIGGVVTIDAKLTPVVVMRAQGGWWLRNDRPNYNLDIDVRGPIHAMWGAETYLSNIKADQPLASIKTRADETGMPRWDLRLLTPEFKEMGILRTNYVEQHCATRLPIDRGVSPEWPYIAAGGEYEQPFDRQMPPIVPNWNTGQIRYVAEIVGARQRSCSYVSYSINRVDEGQINHSDFETPLAFYDVSGQNNGRPNLIIRTERYPTNDPYSTTIDPQQQGRPVARDYNQIRYSWRNAPGDGSFDSKIEVLGFHAYTAVTPLANGSLSIDAPGYEQFPDWVIDREWPAATFVSAEAEPVERTEGIYEWSPRDLGIAYIMGWASDPDATAFSTITPGLRGEYRAGADDRVRLYRSPIDRRWHLVGAQGGLWAIDSEVVLREHNLDGDAYIDGWTRERSGKTEESLYSLDGYLISSEDSGVTIRAVDLPASEAESAPPKDRASWSAWIQQLNEHNSGGDPLDLKSWSTARGGSFTTIDNARIEGVRRTEAGFRFVLHLDTSFHATARAPFNVGDLTAGSYVITYDGHFAATPLTRPSVSGEIRTATTTELNAGMIQLDLQNTGSADLPDASVQLSAVSEAGEETTVATDTVTLLGQSTTTTTYAWTPPHAGRWTLRARIVDSDGQGIALPSAVADIQPARYASAKVMLSMSTTSFSQPLIMWIIGVLISLALIICARLWFTTVRSAHG